MKDFWEAVEKCHTLFVLELRKYDHWSARVEYLRQTIAVSISEVEMRAKQKTCYQDFWEKADVFLCQIVELYFLAISWKEAGSFFEEIRSGRWEIQRNCDHKQLRQVQNELPIIQARKAIEVFRLLPKYGSAQISRLSDGGDPEMAGAQIMVYEKTRQVLLAKIAECWAIVESEEIAEEMLSFLIEVLLVKTDFGPYGSLAVKVFRDVDSRASAVRISRALTRIYPDAIHHSSGPIRDAFDTLKVGWAKKLPEAKIRFLLEIGSILDRSLPEAAEREMIEHAQVMAHLMDVARSFIDHSGKFLSDWEWPSFNLNGRTVELAIHFNTDWINSFVKEMKQIIASWQSPDPSVKLIIHGRKERNSFGPQDESDFFEITVGRQN